MDTFIFILGKFSALSIAEILTYLEKKQYKYKIEEVNNTFLQISIENNFIAQEAQDSLAGCKKIAKLVNQDNFKVVLDGFLPKIKDISGKIKIGLSYYNIDNNKHDLKGDKNYNKHYRELMVFKKKITKHGLSVRVVTGKNKDLSAVIVSKNKLLTKGFEVLVIKNKDKTFYAQTLCVQNFANFRLIDLKRPQRDLFSGMLPPKLAQLMINLIRSIDKGLILDPFCGSGTVLQQALLLGYNKVAGFDKSENAINKTKENINWLKKEFSLLKKEIKIAQCDVRKVSAKIKEVDCIVTEPYLGEPVKKKLNQKQASEVVNELSDLYKEAFNEFNKVLKKGSQIVFVFPVIYIGSKDFNFSEYNKNKNNFVFINKDIIIDKNQFSLVKSNTVLKNMNYYLEDKGTFLYGHKDQKVLREIVLIEKK